MTNRIAARISLASLLAIPSLTAAQSTMRSKEELSPLTQLSNISGVDANSPQQTEITAQPVPQTGAAEQDLQKIARLLNENIDGYFPKMLSSIDSIVNDIEVDRDEKLFISLNYDSVAMGGESSEKDARRGYEEAKKYISAVLLKEFGVPADKIRFGKVPWTD